MVGERWTVVAIAVAILPLLASLKEAGAVTDPFRRDPGHPQWHHGNFQDHKDNVRRMTHELLHSRAQVPFPVALEVNVVLIGFMNDGGYRFHLDHDKLHQHMKSSFPTHRPSCMETGEMLDIEFDISYNIVPVGRTELLATEYEIREKMVEKGVARESEFGKEVPCFEVEATAVEPTFNRLYSYLFGLPADASADLDPNRALPNAIFILNLDKARMDPKNMTGEPLGFDSLSELNAEQFQNQEAGYVYRYRYNGGAASQVWLSHGRYAVIDISAGPCSYGRLESEEGSVGHRTVPRLQHLLLPARSPVVNPSLVEDVFCGQISGTIVSALEHVIAPDVRFETVDVSSRLLVPIIVLRNHLHYSVLQPGNNHSIDVDAIRHQVKGMLQPRQEVMVVAGIHSLHDHERLAMAVAKAMRGMSTHDTRSDGRFHVRTLTFLDGAVLREEMRHSADVLAAGILEMADPELSTRYFRHRQPQHGWEEPPKNEEGTVVKSRQLRYPYGKKSAQEKDAKRTGRDRKLSDLVAPVSKSHGTRVIPVFVLSLEGVDPQLLMEGENLMWVSHDAVFVLQHSGGPITLSAVSETKRMKATPNSPQRHIIAGLAAVVGGLVAPYERASHIHDRPILDWLWASGHHPFGPFSNTSTVSHMLRDTARRNAVYARMHVALKTIRESTDNIQAFISEHLRTPMGEEVKGEKKKNKVELWIDKFYKKTTALPAPLPHEKMERLENYLSTLEDQLVQLSSLLYDHQIKDALGNASTVMQSALFTQDYVEHMIASERDTMRCCKVIYARAVQSTQTFLYGGILVAGFLVYFLVIYFSSSER
ncbi:uncharacterized protein [Physcomitrium patens]|uniref:DUF7906 domain-containing protein n=1 Tax=Physcomitrium patens TaxID=3218 RepID=A0A2K1J7F2_PHYPA|nr:uncharacterized protein LOC112293080 isoform X2 [Physcomitrium patens]PNR37452.1 hypothetical protein PHYPA_020561 [Physcomitrium patens]|eukprot:XP_024397913.1 uncharacterized protein LOC112293080 isoform X2 [Physcomitrella patens]